MNTIRILVVLAVVATIGIFATQIYWVSKALDISEREFHQTVSIALRSVAEKIARSNKSTLANSNPVVRLSSSYYIVNMNEPIDANILEYYLRTEFAMKHLDIDFEYGIYDCSSDSMVYGKYVSRNDKKSKNITTNLPKLNEYNYYFGVRFPTKTMFLVSELGIWIFLSVILIVVIAFFAYALLIILKQRRLSEIQKDFINNMTHEFKTPISTIAIAANVLAKPNILENPEKFKNYVSIIFNENERLKTQVEKVLQMAKIDREKPEMMKERLDLHAVIDDVCTSFLPKIPASAGKIEMELNAQNCVINADKVHTINLVANLIDNALKYSKEKILIRVTTENRKKFIILRVCDEGVGIPEKHLKKIFDKFYRVPTGNVHNVKGFGLGLNYVKTISNMHGWRISVESEVGKGTCFTLKIPTAQP
jgi:two-component system phosphate regulon sensor histidine kinase PhoR